METVLDDKEVRILGCLIEKEMTTPEYYPLSLNSLINACNQKSNRNPVVSFDETTVTRGLESLQEKGLVLKKFTAGSRVPKYIHSLLDRFDLLRQEMAILCELMLRGPQTIGEIRSRAERMASFENLEGAEKTINSLTEQDPPLAVKLPREAGRKENRYMHLFSGSSITEKTVHDLPAEPAAPLIQANERIVKLEEEIVRLRTEVEELKQAFAELKSQL